MLCLIKQAKPCLFGNQIPCSRGSLTFLCSHANLPSSSNPTAPRRWLVRGSLRDAGLAHSRFLTELARGSWVTARFPFPCPPLLLIALCGRDGGTRFSNIVETTSEGGKTHISVPFTSDGKREDVIFPNRQEAKARAVGSHPCLGSLLNQERCRRAMEDEE